MRLVVAEGAEGGLARGGGLHGLPADEQDQERADDRGERAVAVGARACG